MIRKRIYLTAAIFLLVVSFSAYYLYRVNRSARSRLEYANGLIEVNPRKALADVEQINRTFLSERNYMMCDLVKAGALNGVSDCLERLTHYQAQIDSVAYNKDLAQIENVDKLRKTIRDSEVAEAEYYRYWVFYRWIIVIAFTVILILMSISIVLQKKKKNLQLKRQQSRLDALKMQIDPHFIFNNLSILLDLVETGDATAPIYIKCLSKVYRHIVANVDKNLSSVADELSSLEAYIFLLKIRFEDAIQVEIQVQDAIRERQIPPIVLQMLLENAIKHNQVSEEAPLFIRVYSDGDKLVVENNCKPLTPNSSTHHIGLRNIKERYQLTGAPAPEIYQDEHIYRVILSTL